MELCNKTSQPASSKNNYEEKNKKKNKKLKLRPGFK